MRLLPFCLTSLASLIALSSPSLAAADWQAVDATTLESARGGFVAPGGLTIALGIDRTVSVNGEVLAQTHFAIADLSQLSHAEAEQTSTALSSIKLVQNGTDNIYRAPLSQQALAGIVVQNSLDGQLIRTETVIHSTVNSMGLLKAINVQSSLGDALLQSAAYR